jgi:hypothetical protein
MILAELSLTLADVGGVYADTWRILTSFAFMAAVYLGWIWLLKNLGDN